MQQIGAYICWPANAQGEAIEPPTQWPLPAGTTRNIADERAVSVYFGVNPDAPQPPPKEQRQLQEATEKLILTARRVYHLDGEPTEEERKRFRNYYVRAFQIAVVGLEGATPATEIATAALADLGGELVDQEAGRIKNGYLRELGTAALKASFPFACLYLLVRSVPESDLVRVVLKGLGASPDYFSSFMLLWIGCFLGVWLSYGIRKTTFTLTDLTVTEGDRLTPLTRLLFAGSLTMLLGIVFVIPVVDVTIGNFALSTIPQFPMLAFLVGSLCGISELVLPTAIEKRATDFFTKIK